MPERPHSLPKNSPLSKEYFSLTSLFCNAGYRNDTKCEFLKILLCRSLQQ